MPRVASEPSALPIPSAKPNRHAEKRGTESAFDLMVDRRSDTNDPPARTKTNLPAPKQASRTDAPTASSRADDSQPVSKPSEKNPENPVDQAGMTEQPAPDETGSEAGIKKADNPIAAEIAILTLPPQAEAPKPAAMILSIAPVVMPASTTPVPDVVTAPIDSDGLPAAAPVLPAPPANAPEASAAPVDPASQAATAATTATPLMSKKAETKSDTSLDTDGDNAAQDETAQTAINEKPKRTAAAPLPDAAPAKSTTPHHAGQNLAEPGATAPDLAAKPGIDPQPLQSGPLHIQPANASVHAVTASGTPQPIPVNAIAVEIAAQSRAGNSRFEIRLDPAELGRIDVRLDVDRDGNVTSRLTIERVETYDLLRRDQSTLERALAQAGLKTSDNALEFSLRDQGFAQHREQNDGARHRAALIVQDTETMPLEAVNGYTRLLGASSGVDIKV